VINPVSSGQSFNVASSATPKAVVPPQQQASKAPQDTVSLSSAARGGGDVDHDGDSH
jgi:hypothetical protein